MKRLIALTILGIGVLTSIPVALSSARMPSYNELEARCMNQLGYDSTIGLQPVFVKQLRRCITNTRRQYEIAAEYQRRLVRYDQHFWRNAAYGQAVMRESRRSLHRRLEAQQEAREDYYTQTDIRQRHQDLLLHRAARRTAVARRERTIIIDRRQEARKYYDAASICRRRAAGHDRQACLNHLLTQ